MIDKNTSHKLSTLKSSLTLKKNLIIQELKAKGYDIISLIIGEPIEEIPGFIIEKTIQAVRQMNNKYTSSSGLLKLRQLIAQKYNILRKNNELFENNNNINTESIKINTNINKDANSNNIIEVFNSNDVVISNGTKHSIFNVFAAILEKNDEVIIPLPTWLTYCEIAKILEAKVNFLSFDEDFLFDLSELEQKITNKTKLLVLNSPNNPSGQIYSKEFLEKILQITNKYSNLYILMDEIYSDIIFSSNITSIALVNNSLLSRIFIINGYSKKYSMMGWRIGWVISKNQLIIDRIIKLQSQMTGNVCNISQIAASIAQEEENNETENYKKFFSKIQNDYKEKAELAYEILSKNKNIKIKKPQGAFYLFCDISYFIKQIIANNIDIFNKIKNNISIENQKNHNQLAKNINIASPYLSILGNKLLSYGFKINQKRLTNLGQNKNILNTSIAKNINTLKDQGFNKIDSFFTKENIETVVEFICFELLHYHNVAILEGKEFGSNIYIRISYAGEKEYIEKGCNIILQYFNNLILYL